MPRKAATTNGTTDVPLKPAPRRTSAPKTLKYGRPVVEALVKMLEGVAIFLPHFRENPLNELEHTWLVDDWYEFGIGHPLFQRLVLACFSNSVYVRLAASNVGVLGSRLVAYEQVQVQKINVQRATQQLDPIKHPLPLDEIAVVVNAAYVGRMAMQSQDALIEQLAAEQEEDAADVDAGPARDRGRQDGLGEDVLPPLAAQAAGVRPDAGHQR